MFATQEELNKIDYNYLSGSRADLCIYGHMTGNCETERSFELINKCNTVVYLTGRGYGISGNKKLGNIPESSHSNRLLYYISPIEQFLGKYKESLNINSTKVKRLVNFLQNKTDKLVL